MERRLCSKNYSLGDLALSGENRGPPNVQGTCLASTSWQVPRGQGRGTHQVLAELHGQYLSTGLVSDSRVCAQLCQ